MRAKKIKIKRERTKLRLPVRGEGDETHQAAGNETGGGDGNDPSEVDPGDHAPVDGSPVTVAETDADNGASDALGGGDGELCLVVSICLLDLFERGVDLLRRVAMITVMTEPSSMEKPREGDISVTRLPRLRMMWYP